MAEEKPAKLEESPAAVPAPDPSLAPEAEKVEESKAPPATSTQKSSGGSIDRDAVLAKVESDKKDNLIKAWEESEKSKADNKAQKKMSSINSWENTKKASLEAELKRIEEKLEKKKAVYAEKMKNRAAMIHKEAEEKRAMVMARRGEELLKAEEGAAKYRASGHVPKSSIGCFG